MTLSPRASVDERPPFLCALLALGTSAAVLHAATANERLALVKLRRVLGLEPLPNP